jgi:riboflavin-specific deaminase-like protein
MSEISVNNLLWPQILAARTGAAVPPEAPGWVPPLLAPAWVLGQLGQSLDGRIATESGHSHYINGQPALLHLHRLRALADGVLVGAGTVAADNPRLTVRLAEGPHPARILLDPSARLPDECAALADDGCRRLCLQAVDRPRPPGVEIIRLTRRSDGSLDPAAILAALRAAGIHRLLVEGGAATVSGFITAGVMDRIHFLTAPVLMGSGRPGLTLPPIRTMAEALRPVTVPYLLGDGEVLFDCDLRSRQP